MDHRLSQEFSKLYPKTLDALAGAAMATRLHCATQYFNVKNVKSPGALMFTIMKKAHEQVSHVQHMIGTPANPGHPGPVPPSAKRLRPSMTPQASSLPSTVPAPMTPQSLVPVASTKIEEPIAEATPTNQEQKYYVQVANKRLVQAPEWVMEGLKKTSDPQMLIKYIYGLLKDPLSQQMFDARGPPDCLRCCLGVLYNVANYNDVDVSFQTVVAIDTQGKEKTARPVSSTAEHGLTIDAIVFHCCAGIGTSLACFDTARLILRDAELSHTINVEKQFIFETDSDCIACLGDLLDKLRFTSGSIEMKGDIRNMVDVVQEHGSQWAGKEILIFCSPPCIDTSKANTKQTKPGQGFHMSHSRALWPILESCNILAKSMPRYRIHMLCEYPPTKHPEDDLWLNGLLGSSTEVNPSFYGGARRPRNVRSSPKIKQHMFVKNLKAFDPLEAKDNWLWCGNRDAQNRPDKSNNLQPQVVVRSYIPKLITNNLWGQLLQPGEMRTLNSIKMMHQRDPTEVYINRQILFEWMGLGHRHTLAMVLNKRFPCIGHISVNLGNASTSPVSGEPCGKSRYCLNCEKVWQMLGQAWHFGLWADITVAWMYSIINVIKQHEDFEEGDDSFAYPSNGIARYSEFPIHACSDACLNAR